MTVSSIAIYCLNKQLKSCGEFQKSDLRTNLFTNYAIFSELLPLEHLSENKIISMTGSLPGMSH